MDRTGLELPTKNRVYQRDENGFATIPLSLRSAAKVRIRQGSRIVKPLHDTFGAVVEVPAGGPYTLDVETHTRKSIRIDGVLVGDLWVLAGQSNMDGCGKLVDIEPPSSKVHCFYYTEQWDIAQDPLCVLVDSIDPIHWPCEEKDLPRVREEDHLFREVGAGPGVRFGKEIYRATGVPIGLIPCSHGGTSMDQWDPRLKDLGGRSLYGSMIRRIQACGGKVKGILWYQGESDATPELAPAYKEKMRAFIQALRKDLDAPDLPFLMVQISRYFGDEALVPTAPWNLVQQAQFELETEIEGVAVVSSIDSTLDDAVHIDTPSARRIGARLAKLGLVLAYGRKGTRALRPDTMRFTDTHFTQLRIQYKNVHGRLAPASSVRGFFVEDMKGERIPIQSAETAGNSVVLQLQRSAPDGIRLWYGRGFNPATSLHDNDFAAPVFGPVEVR